MRDINQLHPVLQQKVYQLIEVCSQNGITIGIGECLRTRAEQNALYAQGRTTAGAIVTNCKGDSYSSMHQWGVAFDFYLKMDVDGDGQVSDDAFNNSTGLFNKVGSLGQSIGLEWGGSWTSIKDYPHFQLPDWGSTASQLKKAYGTPDVFMKTWTTAPTVAPEAPVATNTDDGAAYVTASSGLNVRSAPNLSNSKNKIGSIPYKAACVVKELGAASANGLIWARVSYGNLTGYVAQKYLNVTTYPKSNPVVGSAIDSTGPTQTYSKNTADAAASKDSSLASSYVTTANLNLRMGASTTKNVIITMPKGSTVRNYGFYTKNGNTRWLLVAYGTYTGYCSEAYLEKVN